MTIEYIKKANKRNNKLWIKMVNNKYKSIFCLINLGFNSD